MVFFSSVFGFLGFLLVFKSNFGFLWFLVFFWFLFFGFFRFSPSQIYKSIVSPPRKRENP